jgi:hypothetical protein
MEMDELVPSSLPKARRSSMMSSLLSDSTERLLLEPFTLDGPLIVDIEEQEEETQDETGEEIHDVLDDEDDDSLTAEKTNSKQHLQLPMLV